MSRAFTLRNLLVASLVAIGIAAASFGRLWYVFCNPEPGSLSCMGHPPGVMSWYHLLEIWLHRLYVSSALTLLFLALCCVVGPQRRLARGITVSLVLVLVAMLPTLVLPEFEKTRPYYTGRLFYHDYWSLAAYIDVNVFLAQVWAAGILVCLGHGWRSVRMLFAPTRSN
jgi:hypothetical protein